MSNIIFRVFSHFNIECIKKLLCIFLLTFLYNASHAQWVAIPDPAFVTFLTQNYPQCMNGNLMDTTCSAIVNETSLICNSEGISDLTGIQYFANLTSLYCHDNLITALYDLPSTLQTFYCNNNQLSSLPLLPASLTFLNCGSNQLTSLPSLPVGLESLTCNNNQLTALPLLPASITYLNCRINLLSSLPGLPGALIWLNCSYNQLSALPPLPNSLENLYCTYNQITGLPSIPNSLIRLSCDHNLLTNISITSGNLKYLYCTNNLLSTLTVNSGALDHIYCYSNQLNSISLNANNLTRLYCYNNSLTSLPPLPGLLEELDCSNNQLMTVPALPASLKLFKCNSNQIDTLPTLNTGLITFECNSNLLVNLPTLPSGLITLKCNNNLLTSLPTLPSSLKNLYCNNNLLTSLPPLNSALRYLHCTSNLLTTLPEFPDTLESVYISGNTNLTCLPRLKKIGGGFLYNVTGIQCIPNYGQVSHPIPPLTNYPLCDLFNTNGCNFYWTINGQIYRDLNGNCINDPTEPTYRNIKVNLYQSGVLLQQAYTMTEGIYSFDIGPGTYSYSIDTTNKPYEVDCPNPPFHTSVLTTTNPVNFDRNFSINCKPGFDVGVQAVSRQSGQFFPGNTAAIAVHAGDISSFSGLNCAAGISGSVIVDISGPVSYISSAPGSLTPMVSGNTLSYTISDFGTVNFHSDFRFSIMTDTLAQAGDLVCFDVDVFPFAGDINITNNTLLRCFEIVNSYDPNEKEVYPIGDIAPDQEWLNYTVYFQNTGNSPAQNIYIIDTLDNNLVSSTFELLSYSHDNFVQIIDNVVRFNFPNINLPDSTNDEPNSHGYVQYRIKPETGLTDGSIISNGAGIYFDFNPPVLTNIVENMINSAVSVPDFHSTPLISVYPNPVKDVLNIAFVLKVPSNVDLVLYNSVGQIVMSQRQVHHPSGINNVSIPFSTIPEGIYFLSYSSSENVATQKIVKLSSQ